MAGDLTHGDRTVHHYTNAVLPATRPLPGTSAILIDDTTVTF
jgi:hypothetical protein